jgi:tRNA pseudouridine38-40 synthase
MPRYKLTIEYDGTPYCGWQKQDDRLSVQTAIENALEKFCGEPIATVAAGRTDAGVHATAQVAHIDLPKSMDEFRIMQGINYYLFNHVDENGCNTQNEANRIAILAVQRVDDEFNARFSATKRHYIYRIINRRPRLAIETGRAWHVVEELNLEAMQQAAQHLIGHRDFSSFRDTQCQAKSPIKTLEQLDIKRIGNEVQIITSARSFLHHQVRIMAGTLALVGKGRWNPDDVRVALNAKSRSSAGTTAPPDGLYLVRVDY